MDWGRVLTIIIAAILVNNFVLAQFLGLCSFIGISQKLDVSCGMGIAVIFVITMSSVITWTIYHWVLAPYHIEYLNIVVFILVTAAFVQAVEIILKKFKMSLYKALGIFLPLITCNCIVLYVTLLNVDKKLTFLESVIQGFAAGVGYWLAMILLTSMRERLETADIPRAFQGIPMAFILAGLLSLAFLGFSGLVLE
ncbi:MAG: RnfABCDGE type electron transport complex subunit A [Candidatus Omnitrophota bacterium]